MSPRKHLPFYRLSQPLFLQLSLNSSTHLRRTHLLAHLPLLHTRDQRVRFLLPKLGRAVADAWAGRKRRGRDVPRVWQRLAGRV